MKLKKIINRYRGEWKVKVMKKEMIEEDKVWKKEEGKRIFIGIVIEIKKKEIICNKEGW